MSARTGVGIALGLGVGAVALSMAQLGPLDPPAGPIMETSPSLADLEAKIDALASSGTDSDCCGPWQIYRRPSNETLPSALVAEQVFDGPVYIKSITGHRVDITVFDGNGEINSSGNRVEGFWFSRLKHQFSAGDGSGKSDNNTITVPVEYQTTGPLFAAWVTESKNSFFYILYRQIEETP